MFLLKVCTNLYASLFVAGWYGALRVCWIPFALQKSVNSLETNWGQLFVKILTGSLAKMCLCLFTVHLAVVDFILMTSGHLLCASTTGETGMALQKLHESAVKPLQDAPTGECS